MARPKNDPWLVKGQINTRMSPWLKAFLRECVSHQLELGEKTSQAQIMEDAILAHYSWAADFRDSWIKTQEMRQAE